MTAAHFHRRPQHHLIGLCAAWLALLFSAPSDAQPNPAVGGQARRPTLTIQAGLHLVRAELADDTASRTQGLMQRTHLGVNEGMLFVFPNKAVHCFWMRNTVLPLSIAFIDDDGTIAQIADMAPQTETSHCPPRAVRYALEMEQGWFAKRGLTPGQQLTQKLLFTATKLNN